MDGYHVNTPEDKMSTQEEFPELLSTTKDSASLNPKQHVLERRNLQYSSRTRSITRNVEDDNSSHVYKDEDSPSRICRNLQQNPYEESEMRKINPDDRITASVKQSYNENFPPLANPAIFNDYFTKMLFYHMMLDAKHSINKGRKILRDATMALLDRQFNKAVDLYQSGLPNLNILDFSEREKIAIRYSYGLTCIETMKTNEDMIKSITIFEDIIQSNPSIPFPLGYYGIALSYYKQNRFQPAIEVIKTGLKAAELSSLEVWSWPFTKKRIPESMPGKLQEALEDLHQSCLNPPLPEAICRYDNCNKSHLKNEIYSTDPDFSGYVSVVCFGNCHLHYHHNCWKNLKKNMNRANDKGYLQSSCLTPDCSSTVKELMHIDEHGDEVKKFKASSQDKNGPVANKKKKSKLEKKFDKKEVKRQKTKSESEVSQNTNVTFLTENQPVTEKKTEEVKSCTSNSHLPKLNRIRHWSYSGPKTYDINSDDFVVWKRDDTEVMRDIAAKYGGKKGPVKKDEDKVIDEFSHFSPSEAKEMRHIRDFLKYLLSLTGPISAESPTVVMSISVLPSECQQLLADIGGVVAFISQLQDFEISDGNVIALVDSTSYQQIVTDVDEMDKELPVGENDCIDESIWPPLISTEGSQSNNGFSDLNRHDGMNLDDNEIIKRILEVYGNKKDHKKQKKRQISIAEEEEDLPDEHLFSLEEFFGYDKVTGKYDMNLMKKILRQTGPISSENLEFVLQPQLSVEIQQIIDRIGGFVALLSQFKGFSITDNNIVAISESMFPGQNSHCGIIQDQKVTVEKQKKIMKPKKKKKKSKSTVPAKETAIHVVNENKEAISNDITEEATVMEADSVFIDKHSSVSILQEVTSMETANFPETSNGTASTSVGTSETDQTFPIAASKEIEGPSLPVNKEAKPDQILYIVEKKKPKKKKKKIENSNVRNEEDSISQSKIQVPELNSKTEVTEVPEELSTCEVSCSADTEVSNVKENVDDQKNQQVHDSQLPTAALQDDDIVVTNNKQTENPRKHEFLYTEWKFEHHLFELTKLFQFVSDNQKEIEDFQVTLKELEEIFRKSLFKRSRELESNNPATEVDTITLKSYVDSQLQEIRNEMKCGFEEIFKSLKCLEKGGML